MALPQIALDSLGKGAPTLFIHGLGGTSNVFRPQMSALSDRFRCLAFDLPGSGRSPISRPVTITSLVAAAVAVLDDAGVSTARIVAHSMGTLVAMHLAGMFPQRVSRLALLGPVRGPTPASETALRARAVLARSDGMAPIADSISESALSEKTKSSRPVVTAFVRELLMRQDPDGYAAQCEALADARPAPVELIKFPTLILTGDSDKTAPPDACQALANAIAGAQFLVLKDCGHWLSLESPDEVNNAISGFLGEA